MAYKKLIDLTLLDKFLNNIKNSFASKDITTQTTVGSANIVTFDASVGNVPIKSLTVNVEPVQSGSGDPSPTNVRPISGWTGANVTRAGKNLFDKTADYLNGKYLNADGTTTDYSGFAISGYINASPSTSYVVSGVSGNSPSVCCYDEDKQYLGGYAYGGQSSKSFTTPVGTAFIRLTIILSSIDTIQLELGSTATAYEPYQGNTYSVSWQDEAGTVYGGALDVLSGVLTVTDANIASYNGETLPGEWISDRDVYSAGTTPTTGAQVVYKLATPQTYQLTPQEVTTLLGVNNIWANTGDVSVEYGDYIGRTLDLINKKADKVQNATNNNFAALDENGNLKDSGHKHSDYLMEHQSLAAYRTAAAQDIVDAGKETAGLGLTGTSIGDLVRVSTIDVNGKPMSWNHVPLCDIMTNQNLLDNWFFIGGGSQRGDKQFPINQRGLTSYPSDGLCIDRWHNHSLGFTTTITTSGLELSATLESGGTFCQMMENPQFLLGKRVCYSALVNDVIYSGSGQFDDTIPINNKTVLTVPIDGNYSLYIQHLANGNIEVGIISTGSTLSNLQAVKLEFGTEQTLAHLESNEQGEMKWVLNEIPNYQQQLTKCRTNVAISYDKYTHDQVAYCSDLGIVQNTSIATVNISVGSFVVWKGSLYIASSTIGIGDILSTFNLNAVQNGGLNALNIDPNIHQKYYAKLSLSYDGATARTRIMLPYNTVAGVYRIDTTCNVSAGVAIPVTVSDNSVTNSIAANGHAYLKMPIGNPSASAGKQIIFVVYPGSANSGVIDIIVERTDVTDDVTNVDIDYS